MYNKLFEAITEVESIIFFLNNNIHFYKEFNSKLYFSAYKKALYSCEKCVHLKAYFGDHKAQCLIYKICIMIVNQNKR